MFRKSRIKIITSIMLIMVFVLLGALAIIYFSSYNEMSGRNLQMLEKYVRIYAENGTPDQSRLNPTPPENDTPPDNETPKEGVPPKSDTAEDRGFETATFCSVAFNKDGSVKDVDNTSGNVENDYIISLGRTALSSNREKGAIEGYNYVVNKTDSYTLVVFMDRSGFDKNMSTLLKYNIIYSLISLAVIFLLALWLSKLIIRPLEKNHIMQKQFVSDAGHELKTPVSIISANAEVLEGEIGDNKWLSNIKYENERMSSLIKQLMALTKTDNEKAEQEQLDFSKLVIGEILPFESVAYDNGITINYDEVESGVTVKGNRAQLGQLVSILIDNAIEHSKNNAGVNVKLINVWGKAQLSVSNKGDEIPEDKKELIFERFYRLDDARTEKKDHYGLGLAIAKSITDAHGGEISVKSDNGVIAFFVKI